MVKAKKNKSSPKNSNIKTKFGEVDVNLSRAVNFPHGIIGFANDKNFCVSDYPNKNMKYYRILQSLDNTFLTFLILPYSIISNQIAYKHEDLMKVTQELDLKIEDCTIYLMINLHNSEEKEDVLDKISINLKAPIIVDANTQKGYQYIFYGSEYPLTWFIE